MSDTEDNAGDTYPQDFGTPQSTPLTPSSPYAPASPLVHGTPLTPEFTPQVPLVEATPRTQQTPLSQITQRYGTALSVPRGDVGGRNTRRTSTPNSTYSTGTPVPMADVEPTVSLENVVPWGTNVNLQTVYNLFSNFLDNFTLPSDFEPYYQRQLHIIHRTQDYFLKLNCSHLLQYIPTRSIYQNLLDYPQEIIPVMDSIVSEHYTRRFGPPHGTHGIQVQTYGLQSISRMRDLDPMNIDQLLAVKGMVIRCSPIIPALKRAYFRCFVCNHAVESMISLGRIEEPTSCEHCTRKGSMEMIHNRCMFSDKQLIRIQETPDEVPEGETPYTVTVYAFDTLVDTVRPGDRLEITGVYRALPRRANPHNRTVRSIFKTYVDAIHMRRVNDTDHMTMENKVQFSESRIREFEEFATTGNVYDKLIRSFAPSIWELEDVKRGALCMLFGGTLAEAKENKRKQKLREQGLPEEENNGIAHHLRSDINILLCGDPGTSKSQLLSYVHKLTPRGIYTSGKGSSAVGLTASVIRDPETRDTVLESGALVLSDNGICCIDEFDKMSDATRAMLHEAMEQQTVSITKAGIIATLNARTSILASANPVGSRYNPNISVVENIKLPPTLLSRFDLIYLVLDKPHAESDRQLARHLVALYYPTHEQTDTSSLASQEFLREYITYSRQTCSPDLTPAAEEALVGGYLAMRAMGGRGSKTITATPRQLESLIRIAEALAKMRLSDTVTEHDVNEAIRLMKVATQTAATDPRTGTIDMGLITAGRTSMDKELLMKLTDEVRGLLMTKTGQRLSINQIKTHLSRNSDIAIKTEDLIEAVKDLEVDGMLQYTDTTQMVVIRNVNR